MPVGDAIQAEVISGSLRSRRPVVERDVGRHGRQRDPVTDCAELDVVAKDRPRRLGRVLPRDVDSIIMLLPARRDVDGRQRPRAVYTDRQPEIVNPWPWP